MKTKWKTGITQWVLNSWYKQKPWLICLLPLSFLFSFCAKKRRANYENKPRWHSPIPIIIVGNITVGGTGKTPVVAALAKALKSTGYTPGIVSRGFGGINNCYPLSVTETTSPLRAGDEPVMLAKMLHIPVIVAPCRVQAAQFLCKNTSCDVIIADDGLQHYALLRHIEIIVVDGDRLLGNGYTLPAGPLREPAKRLREVDIILINGVPKNHTLPAQSVSFFNLKPSDPKPLVSTKKTPVKGDIVHAIAGIGNPQRFFNTLSDLGYIVIPHPFSDHHQYAPKDLLFNDDNPIIMTEKDAIKCSIFAQKNHWYLPVTAVIPADCINKIICLLQERSPTN